jgi:hypothetical protein
MNDKKKFNIHATPYVVHEVEGESGQNSNRTGSYIHNRNNSNCGQDFPKFATDKSSISYVHYNEDNHENST